MAKAKTPTTKKQKEFITNPSTPVVTAAETVLAAPVASAAARPPQAKTLKVAKAESRKNLVPINLDDEIRRRAYELYLQRGQSSGHENDDWLVAEHEVMQRYHQQSA